jgi:hypothetical protein
MLRSGTFGQVLAAVAVVGLSVVPARADKCTGAKLKAISKREAGLIKCQAKVASTGLPLLQAACDTKVTTKFTSAFTKVGSCDGLEADCAATSDDCRTKVRAALPDGTVTKNKCEAKRLIAASKRAGGILNCYAKAAKKDLAVDPTCLTKVTDKFTAAYGKVTGCTGDGQTAAVAALIDEECVTQQAIRNSTDKVVRVCPGCDFLDPSECLFPFPNDYFTVPEPTNDTGLRVSFVASQMPANASGTPIDPNPYHGNDGFSQGASILLHVPNLDLVQTGAAPVTDLAQSTNPNSPIVIVNTTTLTRQLHFAELDANASLPANKSLIIHPAVNFDEGTRYIVALRNLKDGGGAVIPASADFAAYRDNTPLADPAKEARRAHMEDIFATLASAGVARNDLYLAWDFTVASQRNITGRLLFMRDDAFARLGSAAPAFTVTLVENEVDSLIFRRVTGTFNVERYVNSTTAPATFVLDANGLPTHQATPQVADFICNIPRAALADANSPAVPARPSLYGHGLLGSHTEVNAGNVKSMSNEHNFVFCATKWIGMADEDIPNAVGILQDLSKFPSLTDRLQQSMVDQLFLARLMIHPAGFVANPAFQDSTGGAVIDTGEVFYDGNSQGGIFGGTVMGVAQDITRGVLGVPGMNYSLLLTRSTDFSLYSSILYPAYPNELERPLLLALIQMLWDRSEPNGYARHIMNDPLPDTPSHQVLLHEAFGDHQVANVATDIEARTIGASIHVPIIAPGRSYEVIPEYGIPGIASYPFNGSALVVWDSGAVTPPVTNTAPGSGPDPHSDPRNSPIARTQKSEFLKTGGAVVDVCSGLPCVAP